MEQAKEYASIERHFGGTNDSEHSANHHDSLQRDVWGSENIQHHTIQGGDIDSRLRGMDIDVAVAKVDVSGQKKTVAVTCFANPNEGSRIQSDDKFPACRKPIVNRVFILKGSDFDAADVIEAIQDEIAKEEGTGPQKVEHQVDPEAPTKVPTGFSFVSELNGPYRTNHPTSVTAYAAQKGMTVPKPGEYAQNNGVLVLVDNRGQLRAMLPIEDEVKGIERYRKTIAELEKFGYRRSNFFVPFSNPGYESRGK